MDGYADPNDVAIHAHHDEHQDFGTVTPELMLAPVCAIVIKFIRPTRSEPPYRAAQDWSDWSWAHAPPRRAA